MKLYYVPRTSAGRPRWMLEELGVPYELVRLDPSKGETRTPEHKKLHPLGHVPVLVDGDLTMYESAAIVQHLADKYPEKRLAPPVGTRERAFYYQWISYGLTELVPPVIRLFAHTVMLPEERRSPAVVEDARKALPDILDVVERELTGKQYILGQEFSAADILVGGGCIFAARMGLVSGRPAIEQYVARLQARPAWQRANAD